MKVTLTAIKADVGGVAGHTKPSDALMQAVNNHIEQQDILTDWYVGHTGDDVHILMTHNRGTGDEDIHKLAFDALMAGTEVAKQEGLYGAGQDLLSTAFSGNVKGMGPGVCEMEFTERPAEVFTLITADKTEPGAYNLPFYKMFCEPTSNTGLLLNPILTAGVQMNIMDVITGNIASCHVPEDLFVIAAALMYPGRYVVDSVWVQSDDGKWTEPVLDATTDRLSHMAGKYVGKDDPAALLRLQKQFPATEEACAMFKNAHFVAGNTRGSHHMPLMPVKRNTPSTPNYCIPQVSALLFSVKDGLLTGPIDAFETSDWDYFREKAVKKSEMMRENGFVHPATLVPDELEYNDGYKNILDKLQTKFNAK